VSLNSQSTCFGSKDIQIIIERLNMKYVGLSTVRMACAAGINGEGEQEEKNGGLGSRTRERLLQRPPIFSFLIG